MSDEQNLERIFNELSELRKGQTEQGQSLVRIETNLTNHLISSGPYREKVDQHEQAIQNLRGAGWLLGLLWTALVTIVGFLWKSGHGAK